MTQNRAAAAQHRRRGALTDRLLELANTPDDHPGVDALLLTIAQLCVDEIPTVNYASVTMRRADAYTTVAASHEIALAVDQAQYADAAGPCLTALDTGTVQPVPDIAAVIRWPNFRDTAYRLGLRASLSIPLFAGRGDPIAALNLYGRCIPAMTALTAAVWGVLGDSPYRFTEHPEPEPGGLDLVAGLSGALAVRAVIQQAVGVLIARQQVPADLAYAQLRLRAAGAGESLIDVAGAVLAEAGG